MLQIHTFKESRISSLSLQEVQAKNSLWNWVTGSLPTVKETILRQKGLQQFKKRMSGENMKMWAFNSKVWWWNQSERKCFVKSRQGPQHFEGTGEGPARWKDSLSLIFSWESQKNPGHRVVYFRKWTLPLSLEEKIKAYLKRKWVSASGVGGCAGLKAGRSAPSPSQTSRGSSRSSLFKKKKKEKKMKHWSGE